MGDAASRQSSGVHFHHGRRFVESGSVWAARSQAAPQILHAALPACAEGEISKDMMEARLEQCRKRVFHMPDAAQKADAELSTVSTSSWGERTHVQESFMRKCKAVARRSEVSPALRVLKTQEMAGRPAFVTQSLGDLPRIPEAPLPAPSAHTLDELPFLGNATRRFDSSRNRMLRRTKAPNVRNIRDVVAYWRTRRSESDEDVIGLQAVWKPPPLRRTVLDFQHGCRVWSDEDCATSVTADDIEHSDVDSLPDSELEVELDTDLDGFRHVEF